MNNELVESGKEFESCHVKGESISLWVPLILSLIGIVSSIFISHSLLNSSFKTESLFLWPSSLNRQNKPKTTKSISSEVTKLAAGKPEHVKQDSKSFEVDITGSIPQFEEDLQNENKMWSSPKSNANSAATYGANLAGSNKNASDNDSVLSAPDTTATSKKLIETESVANKSVKTTKLATVEQKLSLLQNCPSNFFFTFSRGSAAPDKQDSWSKIQQLTLWVKQHSDTKIFIEGHTDSFGPEEYNLLLSYRRAKAIEKILIDAGISKKQLITRALGEQEPLQDQSSQSKYNRRVSVRIEGTHNCINSLNNGDLD